ncbi:MAG: double-strand break repair helicase AddA [Rhodospirillaceae bacterium]|nr:double-strand break repair helicase AddA [Rhodospirillaceae bacterium]
MSAGTSAVAIAEAEQKKAIHPGASVWVSASAGSGKTKVLTERVLTLLLAGVAPERILCLTFTKAAAAEMSNRVADRLARWAILDDGALIDDVARFAEPSPEILKAARRLFARVLDAPGGLSILTIHAFCQSVLRRFPLEAGVTPQFTVMDERDSAEALKAAQEATIAAAQGDDRALAEALAVVTARVHETSFAGILAGLIASRAKLAKALERHGGVDRVLAATRAALGLDAGDTETGLVAAACAEAAFDRAALRRAVAALSGGSDTDMERAAGIGAWLAAADRAAAFGDYCGVFLTQKDIRKADRNLATKAAQKADPRVLVTMQAEADRLAEVRQKLKAARVFANTEALVRLGAHLLNLYAADKARRGLMDYDDLIERTRRLLERPGSAAWVLYKLDGGIDHVLIDEAQDTNPEQWAIVKALTAEFFAGAGRHEERGALARTVFVVGDRKQSIYGFQGADPAQFDIVRGILRDSAAAVGQPWRDISLNVSFRSTAAVLEAVDTVFSQPGARDSLGEDQIHHLASREGHGGLVEIWPPVEPATRDETPSWKPPVERSEADSPPHRLAALIARRIAHMVKHREMLEAKGRPIRPGDIMVLVRRRTGFVKELVRQLKIHGIAVAGVDRMQLTEQLAVMDLVALGQFLLLPDDELTLATVLKGPLLGLTEDELFALAHGRGRKSLWDALNGHAGAASRFGEAQSFLAALLAKTDYLSPAELYGHILVGLDGRKKLLARLGAEAEDAIDEFLNLALAYQRQHVPSLQGFLHWITAGKTEIKRDLDQGGADAVRVLTAHGAKGLQAPIVFLPDTCQAPTLQDRLFWTASEDSLLVWAPAVDEQDPLTQRLREIALTAQEQEYHRLLYVAMTRAEDRLYICGWHTRRARAEGAWYSLMKEGLAASPRLLPVDDPFFAADTLFAAPEILRMTSEQRALAPREAAPEAPIAPEHLKPWALSPPAPEPIPPQPLAPSTAGRTDPPAASPVKDDGRRRFQRGIVIHRLLQSLPEIAPDMRRAAAEALAARPAWGLDAAARADVVRETLAVIQDPAFASLFAAGSKAEVPITGMVKGHVISGQVDRLAVTAAEVVIVDYKTNRPPASRAEDVDPAYAFQMAVYRAALAQIYPGHRVRCVLLWTDGPFILELPPAQLDAALAALP